MIDDMMTLPIFLDIPITVFTCIQFALLIVNATFISFLFSKDKKLSRTVQRLFSPDGHTTGNICLYVYFSSFYLHKFQIPKKAWTYIVSLESIHFME